MHGTSVVGREVDLQVLDLEQRTLGALQLVEFVVNIRLLSHYTQKEFVNVRGSKMGLVPQDPMSNLNPVWRIGTQVKEALVANNMDVSHRAGRRCDPPSTSR